MGTLQPESLDAVLAAQFPIIPQPVHGERSDMREFGIRYIVGANGLHREVSTPWLHSVLPVGSPSVGARLPYGLVRPQVNLRCPKPSSRHWREFATMAMAAFPNECAAALLWSPSTSQWRLAPRRVDEPGAAYIRYVEAECLDDEIVVVDLHSHGGAPAFFSDVDDADDAGSIKLSVVFGRCERADQMDVASRLCVIDTFVPDVSLAVSGKWEVTP